LDTKLEHIKRDYKSIKTSILHLFRPLFLLLFTSILLTSCADDDNSGNASNNTENRQPLGSSANDLLSATQFTSLTLEIVSVEGFEPTADAIANFRAFIEERVFKPDGITINQRSIPSSGDAPFSIEEIAEIENENRTVFNEEGDIAVYIYFADGSSENDAGDQITLGSAYFNTSMVIYEGTLQNLANNPNAPFLSTIETATLNHEFAHLLGLVDLGSPLQSDHEDEDAENHCNVAGCLMQAAIQFSTGMMGLSTVPELDAQCIADLQANGGR